jgi:molecular chaperone Hsp33
MKNIEEIKSKFKNRDRIIRILSENQHFRAAMIRNTNTALTAQDRHKLSEIPANFLARAMMGSALIANFLKGEERAILHITGNGLLSQVYAESSQIGETRGYVEFNQNAPKVAQIKDMDNVLGIGLLKVTRILYDQAKQNSGIIELIKSDIASDLEYYFNKSEQIPTAIIMEVETDSEGSISKSNGFIIQAMPGCKHEELKEVFEKIENHLQLGNFFDDTLSIEENLKNVLPFDFTISSNLPIDFYCRCSKDNFTKAMITLDIKEIEEMREQNQNELICKYCNEHYYLDEADFTKIIEIIKSQKN